MWNGIRKDYGLDNNKTKKKKTTIIKKKNDSKDLVSDLAGYASLDMDYAPGLLWLAAACVASHVGRVAALGDGSPFLAVGPYVCSNHLLAVLGGAVKGREWNRPCRDGRVCTGCMCWTWLVCGW